MCSLLRTFMKLARPSGVCISEKPIECLKDVTLPKHSVVTLVYPGHTVGLDIGLVTQKECLKSQSNIELKDLDVESLDTEHI